MPASAPAPRKLAWPASAAGGFGEIGWAPEGPVYYRYAVQASSVGGAQFTAEAIADIDGNGALPTTLAADLLETVGPCDALSGQSEF